jgi:hypothetical protein
VFDRDFDTEAAPESSIYSIFQISRLRLFHSRDYPLLQLLVLQHCETTEVVFAHFKFFVFEHVVRQCYQVKNTERGIASSIVA